MKLRHKRMGFVFFGMVGLAVTSLLILKAVNSSMVFFYSLTQVVVRANLFSR